MDTEPKKHRVVIYHANCADGFCCAWLFYYCKFRGDAEYIPANYGDAPPDVTGRQVFIADFSYPRDVLLEMAKQAEGIVLFDHHKSAEKELAGLPFVRFDKNKCGATMVWNFLCQTGKQNIQNPPAFMAYIEDRELWSFKLPKSKEVNAAIAAFPRTFYGWNELYTKHTIGDLQNIGKHVQMFKDRIIEQAVAEAVEIDFAGHKVLSSNCSVLQCASEAAQALAKGRPFGVVFFRRGEHEFIELRSTPTGLDVSKIAKQFGGGGHERAAGIRQKMASPAERLVGVSDKVAEPERPPQAEKPPEPEKPEEVVETVATEASTGNQAHQEGAKQKFQHGGQFDRHGRKRGGRGSGGN